MRNRMKDLNKYIYKIIKGSMLKMKVRENMKNLDSIKMINCLWKNKIKIKVILQIITIYNNLNSHNMLTQWLLLNKIPLTTIKKLKKSLKIWKKTMKLQ